MKFSASLELRHYFFSTDAIPPFLNVTDMRSEVLTDQDSLKQLKHLPCSAIFWIYPQDRGKIPLISKKYPEDWIFLIGQRAEDHHFSFERAFYFETNSDGEEILPILNYIDELALKRLQELIEKSKKKIGKELKRVLTPHFQDDYFNESIVEKIKSSEEQARLFINKIAQSKGGPSFFNDSVKSLEHLDFTIKDIDRSLLKGSLVFDFFLEGRVLALEISDKWIGQNDSWIFLSSLLILLDQKFYHLNSGFAEGEFEEFIKESINLIPFPVILIDQEGGVQIASREYIGLGIPPKKCLKIVDDEIVQEKGVYYQVKRSSIDANYLLFLFLPVTHSEVSGEAMKITANEVSIMSGSLAHEVNNPIAGILAAVSVLMLNPDVTPAQYSLLEQIKAGVERCRDIVKIFLGFARPSDRAINQESTISGENGIEQAFSFASQLMRYRTLESSLKVDFKMSDAPSEFIFPNWHTLAITFYLIFNDIVTAYLQARLRTKEDSSRGLLSIEVSIYKREIQLQFIHEHVLSLYTDSIPKLLEYLLSLLNLSLQSRENTMVLQLKEKKLL